MTFTICMTSVLVSCLHISPFYCFFVWYRVCLILTLHWCNQWFLPIALAWAAIIIRSPRKQQDIHARISLVPMTIAPCLIRSAPNPPCLWSAGAESQPLAFPLRWGIRQHSWDEVSCEPYFFGKKNNGWHKTAMQGKWNEHHPKPPEQQCPNENLRKYINEWE